MARLRLRRGLFHNYVILRHINHNKNVMREGNFYFVAALRSLGSHPETVSPISKYKFHLDFSYYNAYVVLRSCVTSSGNHCFARRDSYAIPSNNIFHEISRDIIMYAI